MSFVNFSPGKLKNSQESILNPESSGLRLIPYFSCMDPKKESTASKLLNKKWSKVLSEMKGWHASRNNFKLGQVQVTAVQSDVWIVHCLAAKESGEVDPSAAAACMQELQKIAKEERAGVHCLDSLFEECPTLEFTTKENSKATPQKSSSTLEAHLKEQFPKLGISVYTYSR